MKKNKTKKALKKNKVKPSRQSENRILFLTVPVAISLFLLMIFGQISPLAALIAFLLTFVLMFWLARPFLKELDTLITYLKQEAEGRTTLRMPKFFKRRREAFKIVQSFHQIKMGWLLKNKVLEAQTLSDTAILESLPEPLLMLNGAADIVSANLSARQLLGGGIIFKHLTDVLSEKNFQTALNRVLEHTSNHEEVEFHASVHNKKFYFKALINWLPAMTKNGAELVVVLNDITKFKIFEKSQNAFFANASHELKTPLSVLSGFIETLQGPAKDDSDAREKFLNIMAEQTTHMTDLVSDLLALSKLDLDTDAPTENILIADLIRSVFQALELKASYAGKKLILKENASLPPFKGRSSELFRVFQNLIDNAIKYGKSKSSITVTLDVVADEGTSLQQSQMPTQTLLIKIHNLGSVIPEDEIPHLFERFYRMESNMQKSGTGLGLAIASEIIQKYQGKIDVESIARQGTTFTVSLPMGI